VGKLKAKRKRGNVAGPLPPAIEELRRVFTALNTVYGFLQRQHMQPTWVNVKEALQQLCFQEGKMQTCVQAVKHLAALCPKASYPSHEVHITSLGLRAAYYGASWCLEPCINRDYIGV
jgi:hypothetical protein